MAPDRSTETSALPPDDLTRQLVHVRPETDESLPHVSVAGGTYTILLSGRDTAGRFALIDMYIPPGGGPPPHRHDFEEMFHVLDGQVELMFRGTKAIANPGEFVQIPANAPHAFKIIGDRPARLLCLVAPAGEEEFFQQIGDPVPTRTSPPPHLDDAAKAARAAKTMALAAKFKNEILAPK